MMKILVDNNEQLPYTFAGITSVVPYEVVRQSLDTADYQVHVGKRIAAIERKSLSDLYGTASRGRGRFERMLERMRAFDYRAIVIEADFAMIGNPNPHLEHPTKMLPKSMIASLLAWNQRFDVNVFAFANRQISERLTFRILERFYRDNAE